MRRDPNLAPVFICPFVVLTNERGEMFNAMRGIQGQSKGTAMNMGTYRLDGELDDQCPMHFSWDDAPVAEPYHVVEDRDAVSYVGASGSFRLDWGVDTYRWEDGGGRLQLEAKRLGQVATFWVPEQDGYDHPQMLRSHLGKAVGTLDGEPVEGLFMLDYIYSLPGAMWTEMGMLTKLHRLWLNWLVEYEDGTLEGGYAWNGRPGLGFAAAHHFVDGRSTARSDAVMATQRTARGGVSHVSLQLGDTTVELAQQRRDRLAAPHLRHRHLGQRSREAHREELELHRELPAQLARRSPTTRPRTPPSTAAGRRSSA